MMSSHSIRKPRSSRSGFLTLAGIAAIGLFLSANAAFAGSAEINALNAALSPQTIQTATGQQLANAVVTVINGNPGFKPGVVAGEALKGAGSNASDAGSKIANATIGLPTVTADKIKYAADAVKTAGTKAGANVAQIPTFIQPFVDTDAEAVSIAKKIPTVTSGVGAIFGGRALDLMTDAAKLALGNTALTPSNGLLAATQSIAQFIGDTVIDSDQFAHDLSVANIKQTTKIAPGVTAADPTNAGEIVKSIVNEAALLSVVQGKAATLAKGVAAVADIEQVELVGQAIGAKIGSGVIKLSRVNAIAKGLVKGISVRPASATGANRLDNEVDEIGEVGAYFANAIAANSAFSGTTTKAGKKAGKIIVGLLKTIVKSSKSTANSTLQMLVAPDVAGSVTQTVKSYPFNATIAAAIQAALTSPKAGKKIGGTAFAASVSAAIAEVYNSATEVLKYENGTIAAFGNVTDPETDFRGS